MLKTICKCASGICIAVGVAVVIGTAGSSDLELIDFETTVARMIIGLSLFGGGFFGLKVSGFKFDI